MTEVTVALFLYMQFLLKVVCVVRSDKAHLFAGGRALVDLYVLSLISRQYFAAAVICFDYQSVHRVSVSSVHEVGASVKSLLLLRLIC